MIWFAPESATGACGLSPTEWSAAHRAAPLGRVPGAVVAAVFATLDPAGLAPTIDAAWAKADPAEVLAIRLAIAERDLTAALGAEPAGLERAVAVLRPAVDAYRAEGHPLFAGLRTLPWPATGLGQLWRACDMIREHRGASHANAWRAAGLDAAEINALTDAWRGPSPAAPSTTSTWRTEVIVGARERLREAGLLDGGGEITAEGRSLREGIEAATDLQEREVVEALGDDLPDLLDVLGLWAKSVAAGFGR